MRDVFEAVWLRSEGAYRAKRLSDNARMAKNSRIFHIKIVQVHFADNIV